MDDSLESNSISALLSYSKTARHSNIQELLPKYSSPLKTNFESRNLWLRFGLTLALSYESPRSALQAFNECQRIDPLDPLPAMLAARLSLEELEDPEGGLEYVKVAIERCMKLVKSTESFEEKVAESKLIPNGHGDYNSNIETASDTPEPTETIQYLEGKCYYKNIAPLLSKCYLLASIMHAQIYEREPESIKQSKKAHLNASLRYLDLAASTYSKDHLLHFHKALHAARQRDYAEALHSLHEAIRLNPHHVPSIQLLILTLSASDQSQALLLCHDALHEFHGDMLLLYIKCNLEKNLAERNCAYALDTAQCLLRRIRKSAASAESSKNQQSETKQTTNLFVDNRDSRNKQDFFSKELSIWLLVAEIFIKLGSIKDAELCADEGAAHVNGALSDEVLFTRGLIAKAKSSYLEAKSFFQSCLALSPKHAKALQQLAHVHYLLGNLQTAEKFFKDSLDVDSDSHETWHFLSLVYIETKQHDKASDCTRKSTDLEKNSPVISISAISRLTLE